MIHETRLDGASEPAINTVFLPQLQTPYPPIGHWVADNTSIYNEWKQHLATVKLCDRMYKRYSIMVLDPTQLQLDVKSDKSIIICHKDSLKVVRVILRDYVKNKNLLEWVSRVVQKSTEVAKSVQVRTF